MIKTLCELFDALVMGQGQLSIGGKSYTCLTKILTDGQKLISSEVFKHRMCTLQKTNDGMRNTV